jgi:Tfp pilus assembly protein PilP
MRVAIALLALLAACGDDDPPKPPPKAAGQGTAAGAGGAGSGTKLVPQVHVEQQVHCPIRKAIDKNDKDETTCDPKAAVSGCKPHRFCLEVAGGVGFYCQKCPERETIRHVFAERDFIADQYNRDPFVSFLQPTAESGKEPDHKAESCGASTQKIPDYSYADLKVVGIVSQGTNRRVLLMAGNKGYIIKRGECVGKEKAYVKEIGTSYITFQLQNPNGKANGEGEEKQLELYPKGQANGMTTDSNPPPQGTGSGTPVVAPGQLVKEPEKAPGGGATTITPKMPDAPKP